MKMNEESGGRCEEKKTVYHFRDFFVRESVASIYDILLQRKISI